MRRSGEVTKQTGRGRLLIGLVGGLALLVRTAALADNTVERLDRVLPRWLQNHKVAGMSALVLRGGQIVWERNLGMADVARRVPVEPDTMFMLASVSKTVTAVAMMMLVEDGAIGLDTPIDSYLPFRVRNPAHPNRAITVRMLLTHTSSIADGEHAYDNYVQGDSSIPLASFLAGYFTPGGRYYAADNFLASAPGEQYEYSNEGVALVGLLVQLISGQSFESFCAARIFAPLGMEDTAWRLADLDARRVALPYFYDSYAGRFISFGNYGYPDIPNGALRTTARQLAKFLQMFANGGSLDGTRLLDAATVDEMRRDQVPDLTTGQGLVWYSRRIRRHTMLGHDGGDDGVSTAMFYEPDTGIGIVVLTNDDRGAADAILTRLVRYAPRL